MASFHDVQFPPSLSFGALGGPERKTQIVTMTNGHEHRNTKWSHSRRRYDAGMGLRSLDDLEKVIAFFEARQAQLFSFRWKDWADYKTSLSSEQISVMDQVLGIGDGQNREFDLIKTYTSGAQSYIRPIKCPIKHSVICAVQGTPIDRDEYDVDLNKGCIVFHTAPTQGLEVSAGFEFDVPVRFDTDRLQINLANFQAGEVPDIPVVEVRL